MSVIFIGGDEPYLVDAKRKSLLGDLQMPELNLLTTEILDEAVLDHLNTYPVIDDKRVAVVTVEKLADADNDILKECMGISDALLLVIFKSYDGRNTFYKELKKSGVLFLCNKQEAAKSLSSFLLKRAEKIGVIFQDCVLQEFLQRMDYMENDGVNIYTIIGYLESMAALGSTITSESVEAAVPAYQSENVFGIVDLILSKDLPGLRTQAVLLKKDAIGTLSALLREYRISYKAQYFPLSEIGISSYRLKGCTKEALINGITLITEQIQAIKNGTISEELVLEDTFLRLVTT